MKPMHIAMALLSAAMFFVLAGVFMGVQLELDGTKLVVDTASDIRWQPAVPINQITTLVQR